MFALKLFGPGSTRYRDQSLDGFPSQQTHLLLCYILLNRHYPVNREALASVFWGEYSTVVSKKHLSRAIWRLRRVLQDINVPIEEYLSITNDSISFLDSTQYWLDIEVFENAVVRYQNLSGKKLLPNQAAELEEAVSLYSGDLLEGVYLDWALNDRERLGLLYQNALVQLMDYHEVNRSYSHALDYGRLLLRRDETYENIHRKMMRLYWLSGQRSAALTQYKQCQQILQKEFNASPGPETARLYRQIQRNQTGTPPSPAVSTAISPAELTDAVKKISTLQKTIEEATVEIRRLERVLSLALSQG